MDIFVYLNVQILVVLFVVVGSTYGTVTLTKRQIAVVGQNISLQCQLEPLVTILSWRKEEEVIFHHPRLLPETSTTSSTKRGNKTSEIDTKRRKATLTINFVQHNDYGQYECSQFQDTGPEGISYFYLLVYGYPRLSVKPRIAKENEIINSTCCLNSSTTSDEISISWQLGGKPLLQFNKTTPKKMENGVIRYCSNGLEIRARRDINEETLTCFVGSLSISASHVMNVLYPPTVKLLSKSSLTIHKNEKDVYIVCEGNGNPQPHLRLQKRSRNGEWYNLDIGPTEENEITWTFYLGNESYDLAGMYRCIGFNEVGGATPSKMVEITYDYSNSKKNVSTILLVVVLLVICLFVGIKVFKKRRRERYEYYMEATRNFYSRQIYRLSNSVRRLTSTLPLTRNTNTLPDICSHSSLDKNGEYAEGDGRKTDTNVKASNTLQKPRRTFGNLRFTGKGDTGNVDPIYANFSLNDGNSNSEKETEERSSVLQYATLSKMGNTTK